RCDGGLPVQEAPPSDVPPHHPLEDAVEATEEPPERAAHLAPGPQEQRRERRAQRERVERRDQDGHGDRHRELLVHPPGDAGDERRRDEHRCHDEGDGHDRSGHLVHRLQRGVARGEPLLDVLLDGLHHDDGVVDDEADGQHEAEERQRVDRESQQRKDHEGADERDRHRQQRYQRRAEPLQADEDHEDEEVRLARRSRASTVYVNSWPGGTGSPPSWPAGFTVSCACNALAISFTVMSSFASVSGLTQSRMAYCEAPKICTWPMPGTRVIGSLMLTYA